MAASSAEVFRVNFRIVKSALEEEVLSMQLERPMTPLEVMTIWEKEWGVRFATRIKFEAPPGHGSKWLNQRNDTTPTDPVVVKLSAPNGSVLNQLSVAASRNGATAAKWTPEGWGPREEKVQKSVPGKSCDEDRAFSLRLQKMAELRKAQLTAMDQRQSELQQELEEDRRLEKLQEQDQSRWEREQQEKESEQEARIRLLNEQKRRKAKEEALEQEQLRLLEQKDREELEEKKRERERLEQEEQDKLDKERQELEDEERKIRLVEVERERTEREGQDPKFRDAMEKRRLRQEQNRLRQEAREGKVQPVEEFKLLAEAVIDQVLPIPVSESLLRKEDLRGEVEDSHNESQEQADWDSTPPVLAALITGYPCCESAWSKMAPAIAEGSVSRSAEPKRSGVFAIPKRRSGGA